MRRRAEPARRCRALYTSIVVCGFAGALLQPSLARAEHARTPAFARAPDGCTTPPIARDRQWPAPLNRTVSVRGGVLSLRDAIDRLAAAARVRVTYSDALLPLERRVCLDVSSVALGDALSALVTSASVTPRVLGADLIVLASTTAADTSAARPGRVVQRAAPLERVLVTGTATGGAQRSLSVAVGVVDGRDLEAQAQSDLGAFVSGTVPGIWMWHQSPTSLLARYGSIRGASSFGLSYPKIYIDGIEVANPLVVAQMPAESVERVEVLRGPQGAALYGTDAISGVLHVITRPASNVTDAPGLRTRAQGGVVTSVFTESGTFGQEVVIAGQRGNIARSASGSLGISRLGAFVPEGESQYITASGRARAIGRNTIIDATARVVSADVASSSNPIVLDAIGQTINIPDSLRRDGSARRLQRIRDSLASRFNLDRAARQSLRQFTAGVSATAHPSARWTHRGTIGVDAYTLDGSVGGITPVPSPADSALRAAEGSATRLSARASSTGSWSDGLWQRSVTVSAEHAVLREATTNAVLARPGQLAGNSMVTEVWRQTSGVVTQLDAAWNQSLFFTAGGRVERSAGFVSEPLVSLLPMLGVSHVRELAGTTLKLRGAYGKGIRPPRTTVGGASLTRAQLIANPALEPEEQTGIEFGGDLFWGRRASLHVTRFDQVASGLVQPVAVLLPPPIPRPEPQSAVRQIAYQMQNVGAIDNRGWELEATVRGGPFVLHGSLAVVDSRVRDVRRRYSGELRPGDRMLDVPANTMGLSARWLEGPWGATLQVTRVSDWIGYDRVAAAQLAVTPSNPVAPFLGAQLRELWVSYPGVTRVNATAQRTIARGITLQVSGENLLDRQTGEPDNITIVPGRMLSIGVRAQF